MTSSLNRIVLATAIALSATSAFAASSRVHQPREPQAISDYRVLSNAPEAQGQSVLTPAEKVQYERTRLFGAFSPD